MKKGVNRSPPFLSWPTEAAYFFFFAAFFLGAAFFAFFIAFFSLFRIWKR